MSLQKKSQIIRLDGARTQGDIKQAGGSHVLAPPLVPDVRPLRKKHLVNIFNYLNFQDRSLKIVFKHERYDHRVALEARPEPCSGAYLDCSWIDANAYTKAAVRYQFECLEIDHDRNSYRIEPPLVRIGTDGLRIELPSGCRGDVADSPEPLACTDIEARLIQNSAMFNGLLLGFKAGAFHVQLDIAPPQVFDWINSKHPINLVLTDKRQTLYGGECRIVRHTHGTQSRTYVLCPLTRQIQRFNAKEYRSPRQELTPSPDIVFRHPFTQRQVGLKAVNVSGSGFAVESTGTDAMLIPGMIIPELTLTFAANHRTQCRAQVIYCHGFAHHQDTERLIAGLVILDMDSAEHMRLLAQLHQAHDRHSYVCNHVDMDALWLFFFESGFIYPEKYAHLQTNKEKIKAVYTKLYTQQPHIARHFIYQDNGQILGHMAMLRFYQNTWMIHHHAASRASSFRAGLSVLNQIGRFTYDSHRLYSVHMHYLMCYFRPENRFPKRVFGGAVEAIGDPKGCSNDLFAYCHLGTMTTDADPGEIQRPAGLRFTQSEDLEELRRFYENRSGGMMLDALDLTPEMLSYDELDIEYQKLGLKRERYLLSLQNDGVLEAVFIVTLSDLGLNLSDLTNCVTAIILEPDTVPSERFHRIVDWLAAEFQLPQTPVLVYPQAYAVDRALPHEKSYQLWVLNTQYSDQYFRYLGKWFDSASR